LFEYLKPDIIFKIVLSYLITHRINKSLLFLLRPPIIILVVIVVFVASSSYMHAAILMFTLGHVLFSSGSALSVQELHIVNIRHGSVSNTPCSIEASHHKIAHRRLMMKVNNDASIVRTSAHTYILAVAITGLFRSDIWSAFAASHSRTSEPQIKSATEGETEHIAGER